MNVWQNNQRCGSSRPTLVESQCYQVRDPLDLAVLAAAISAACIGFLWWNAKAAQIIMGDVGSLAIGVHWLGWRSCLVPNCSWPSSLGCSCWRRCLCSCRWALSS